MRHHRAADGNAPRPSAALTGRARPVALSLLAAWLTLALSGQAFAAPRPDTRTISCKAATSLVARDGAIVMTTGTHTFRRFVANRSHCDRWETTRPHAAQTLDDPACPISVCAEPYKPEFDDGAETH